VWDWELLKNNSGRYTYNIVNKYNNEDFQYSRSVSQGTQADEFFPHNHAMYELEYCISGDVVYMVEGVRYEMTPGTLLLIAPAVPHKLFMHSEKPFDRHSLYISYAGSKSPFEMLAKECLPSLGAENLGSVFYSKETVADLLPLFAEIEHCSMSSDTRLNDLTPLFVQAILAKLKILACTQKPTMYSVGENHTMDSVKDYLIRNLAADLTLQDIADRFSLSKDYCNKLFRKNTGMSIMQFIKYNRVLHARQMLSDGIAPSEAAERVGFGDYSSFYRAYRTITGRKPSKDYQIGDGGIQHIYQEDDVPAENEE